MNNLALALSIAVVLGMAYATFPMWRRSIEEPDYRVIRRIDNVEIREYGTYVVAEVVVTGSADSAGNDAFPILAGYIFGKNKAEKAFAMTAPVTQALAPAGAGDPASASRSSARGGYVVQFVLPRDLKRELAPEPDDARVRLREVPPGTIAAIRYSGFWSGANYADHLEQLEDVLRAAGLRWTGPPVFSRYNAPTTPWFLRRNEIWLNLQRPGAKPDETRR